MFHKKEKHQKVKEICEELIISKQTFQTMNIETPLKEMNKLNKEGFTMKKENNQAKKITGAILSSAIFELLFLLLPVIITYFQFTDEEKIPWILYILTMLFFLFPIIATIINLINRLKEIKGGEEDEASKY